MKTIFLNEFLDAATWEKRATSLDGLLEPTVVKRFRDNIALIPRELEALARSNDHLVYFSFYSKVMAVGKFRQFWTMFFIKDRRLVDGHDHLPLGWNFALANFADEVNSAYYPALVG